MRSFKVVLVLVIYIGVVTMLVDGYGLFGLHGRMGWAIFGQKGQNTNSILRKIK